MTDKSKLIDIDGLKVFKNNYDIEVNEKIANASTTVTKENIETALGYVPANESNIPTKISSLVNDIGYLTEFTEEDPTVPIHVKNITTNNIANWDAKAEITDIPNVPTWALQDNKPIYTASEIGLGNVDNTSDLNKPVSTKQQSAIDAVYANSNAYTDQKIADLINGAPTTLDTLGEIASAMQEHEEVVSALNNAIGSKASQSELDTHTSNDIIHITASERNDWNLAKTHADSVHAPSNAQVNIIETVKVNGTTLTPSSKSVNVIIPTKLSELTNDVGFKTTNEIFSSTQPASQNNGDVWTKFL